MTMAKRFTDTAKWNEDWFLDLSNSHKLFWIYVCDNCDHAGVFKPNKRMFELLVGEKIDIVEFFNIVNQNKVRVLELNNGRWYLTGFISFQYGGKLNDNNRVHKSILALLNKNEITWVDEDKPTLALSDSPTEIANIESPKGSPESIAEAIDYFKEKGSTKNEGEKFYYFYESKGWMIGKSKMKNWKMSASGWISRNKTNKPDSDYLGGQLKAMKG
tara:strand:- start:495 stop:1142 length:648 start_codon:yes stop_codon:yes gene_type:complete